MKTAENKPVANQASTTVQPFFNKGGNAMFSGKMTDDERTLFSQKGNAFFDHRTGSIQQKKDIIQRQEQPDPPETKPVTPVNTQPAASIPFGKKNRAANCSSDPKFPNFGCFGQQLKLDIDENLLNNAHHFNRVATLYPGDNKLMLDTFLRYAIGKNLLETSFGFAGVNKKWSSMLSYGTGVALKSYDLIQNGRFKLDVQFPIGNNVNLDIKLDFRTNPNDKPGEEKFNTIIGLSGSF